MKSGTPSVFATISSISAGGRRRPPDVCSTRAAAARRARRLSVKAVTWGKDGQGGVISGRNVMITSTGRRWTRCKIGPRSSSDVGSNQCASSSTDRTGRRWARPSSCARSTSSVLRFWVCGKRSSGGYRPSVGMPRRAAMSGTASVRSSVPWASKDTSLESRIGGVSSRSNAAARSSWSMNGQSTVLAW